MRGVWSPHYGLHASYGGVRSQTGIQLPDENRLICLGDVRVQLGMLLVETVKSWQTQNLFESTLWPDAAGPSAQRGRLQMNHIHSIHI